MEKGRKHTIFIEWSFVIIGCRYESGGYPVEIGSSMVLHQIQNNGMPDYMLVIEKREQLQKGDGSNDTM